MTRFSSEIQRRGVLRIGAAYVVTAWLIAQIASFLVFAFDAPPWIIQSIV
jgi:hypothetical protein